MSVYTIQDKIVSKVAKELIISNVTCDIFQNAWYTAMLRNPETSEIVLSEVITMTPEEYSQWGTSDDYILQLTQKKLKVVIV